MSKLKGTLIHRNFLSGSELSLATGPALETKSQQVLVLKNRINHSQNFLPPAAIREVRCDPTPHMPVDCLDQGATTLRPHLDLS